MDNTLHNILSKFSVIEGKTESKKESKTKPFENLKKTEEDFVPMVGGVEFAEEKSEDVLSKVKASLADYLKSAEEGIKQDKDLLKKKKEDLDLKKKELKDLELQQKKKAEELDENAEGLNVGDPVIITGKVQFEGATGEIVDFTRDKNFVVVDLYNHGKHSFHSSDVSYNDYADSDEEEADMYDRDEDFRNYSHDQEVEEGDTYAQGGTNTYAQDSNSTYAESAPVKTVNVEWTSGGGSVLVEIHGDERDGFRIRRAGKELPTKFKSLSDAEVALDMFNARHAAKLAAAQSADYIEEK